MMSQAEVKRRTKGLGPADAKAVVCALVGHSRIQTHCFGYYYCARCEAQVGDSLGSAYSAASTVVIVGHNCKMCRKNAKRLTWRDRMLSPKPFAKEKADDAA